MSTEKKIEVEAKKEPVHRLSYMTYDEVKARAQRILDLRGRPPYTKESFTAEGSYRDITDDEVALITEFVTYWMPELMEKEKPK